MITLRVKTKYENLYPKNPKTGNRVIEVLLEDYMDFFHEWDNATFRKRDMHPDLAEFLDRCSEDIPIKEKIEISFCVKHDNQDIDKEKVIIESYTNYFAFYNRIKEKKIKNNIIKALVLVFISLCIILSYEIFINNLPETVWNSLFLEGLIIGGWVFMWEALHVMTFEVHEYVMRNKEIKRLLKAPVIFEYRNFEI